MVINRHIKVPIIGTNEVCWYEECSGGNLMSDAAYWYLEQVPYQNKSWKESVAATVWHGGAIDGVIPGKLVYYRADRILSTNRT